MGRWATSRGNVGSTCWVCAVGLALLSAAPLARAQNDTAPNWRRLGNAAIDLALPGAATGPVLRVWYDSGGARLLVLTASGTVYETTDFESWKASGEVYPPMPPPFSAIRLPEEKAAARPAGRIPGRGYAFGRWVWRTEDGGANWTNLTRYRRQSILGAEVIDLAVSPANPEEVALANAFGVWRSLDGGLSWTGINERLPNLPVRRIVGLPSGARGLRLLVDNPESSDGMEIEWAPGEKLAWRIAASLEAAQEAALRRSLSEILGAEITAVASVGPHLYAGSADGRLWSSPDQGQTWLLPFEAGAGRVEGITILPGEARTALAAIAAESGPRVLRTVTGGSYWRDLTSNLPAGAVYSLAADRGTGAIYAATAKGVFMTYSSLIADSNATPWTALGGNLPAGAVRDVRLDGGANQLYAAVEGWGVFVAIAPHRMVDPRIVGAADLAERPAAPGALLSVLGRRVQAARSGNLAVPVLHSAEDVSQLLVPFEAQGESLRVAVEAPNGGWNFGLPLQRVSPAIFVDPEGAPFVMDAATGVMLNAATPARSGSSIQILAAGLGRVRPDWPTGLAAPLDRPPQVIAALRVFLDRMPLTVRRATLAPGYVGFYLIEAELPEMVNAGPLELYLEAEGVASNRVRLHVEP